MFSLGGVLSKGGMSGATGQFELSQQQHTDSINVLGNSAPAFYGFLQKQLADQEQKAERYQKRKKNSNAKDSKSALLASRPLCIFTAQDQIKLEAEKLQAKRAKEREAKASAAAPAAPEGGAKAAQTYVPGTAELFVVLGEKNETVYPGFQEDADDDDIHKCDRVAATLTAQN